MAVSRHVDLLEPIDLSEHLEKVELYLGQVCQVAGISKMQLDYWTNKAQIPTKGKKQRIYDMDALETVMLIKQGKDKGLNLLDGDRGGEQVQGRALAPARPGGGLGLAQHAGGRLRRQRVHEVAGAELEPGQDGRTGARPRGASGRTRGATRSAGRAPPRRVAGGSLRRGVAERAASCGPSKGSWAALAGHDEHLVRLPAGERAEEEQAVPLVDDADALLELLGEDAAEDAAALRLLRGPLLGDQRRLFLEPDELRVAVGEAGSGGAALVDERVDVGEALLARCGRAVLPRVGDLLELAAGEVGERAHVSRRVDDDLLPPARGPPGEEAGLGRPRPTRGRTRGTCSGTTRTHQPGASAGRPGGPIAKVSGGVADSRPAQKGQPATSSLDSSASGRACARAGAPAPARSPPSGRRPGRGEAREESRSLS